jgi:hypothetical protein
MVTSPPNSTSPAVPGKKAGQRGSEVQKENGPGVLGRSIENIVVVRRVGIEPTT